MNLLRSLYFRLTERGIDLPFTAERGQTMAEYAILLTVIAVVVVTVAVVFGSSISGIFRDTSSHL